MPNDTTTNVNASNRDDALREVQRQIEEGLDSARRGELLDGEAVMQELRRLRVAGIIIWTKLRQEYLNSEVRECSSSRDESCGGGRGVLPFGTLSL